MKFVTYSHEGEERVAVVASDGERGVDLAVAAKSLGLGEAPADMLALIERGDAAVELARAISARERELPPGAFVALDGQVLAPIPRPRKNVFAVGLNYVRHTREFTGSDHLPENPIIF